MRALGRLHEVEAHQGIPFLCSALQLNGKTALTPLRLKSIVASALPPSKASPIPDPMIQSCASLPLANRDRGRDGFSFVQAEHAGEEVKRAGPVLFFVAMVFCFALCFVCWGRRRGEKRESGLLLCEAMRRHEMPPLWLCHRQDGEEASINLAAFNVMPWRVLS